MGHTPTAWTDCRDGWVRVGRISIKGGTGAGNGESEMRPRGRNSSVFHLLCVMMAGESRLLSQLGVRIGCMAFWRPGHIGSQWNGGTATALALRPTTSRVFVDLSPGPPGPPAQDLREGGQDNQGPLRPERAFGSNWVWGPDRPRVLHARYLVLKRPVG